MENARNRRPASAPQYRGETNITTTLCCFSNNHKPSDTFYVSVSLCVSPSDVRLCQVAVHLRSGQEETFLPAAATLPGPQTGSGFLSEPDDQSDLQTFSEETVHEERRP